jgi:hypothetical protein
MQPVEERLNLDPSRWEAARERELKRFGVSLRRQLEQTARAVALWPTDAGIFRPRVRLLRYVIRNADLLGLTAEQRDRIQKRTEEFRQLPPEKRWPVIDKILLEAAAMLPAR